MGTLLFPQRTASAVLGNEKPLKRFITRGNFVTTMINHGADSNGQTQVCTPELVGNPRLLECKLQFANISRKGATFFSFPGSSLGTRTELVGRSFCFDQSNWKVRPTFTLHREKFPFPCREGGRSFSCSQVPGTH